MTKDVPTAPGDPSELLSPDDFERGWRLHGALLDQALGSYREHRTECAGCPGIEADASNFSQGPLCRVGETLLSAMQAAHRAFARNAIEQARGSFVGLSDGSVILVFKESQAHGMLAKANRDYLPATWIAIAEGQPVGSVSLVEHDMPDRPGLAELAPWLAGPYVVPSHRHMGIARQLVRKCESQAGYMGTVELFLYTATADPLYAGLGWQHLATDRY